VAASMASGPGQATSMAGGGAEASYRRVAERAPSTGASSVAGTGRRLGPATRPSPRPLQMRASVGLPSVSGSKIRSTQKTKNGRTGYSIDQNNYSYKYLHSKLIVFFL
jgi:hypothetical protein